MSKEERYLQNKSPEIIVEKSLGVASKIPALFLRTVYITNRNLAANSRAKLVGTCAYQFGFPDWFSSGNSRASDLTVFTFWRCACRQTFQEENTFVYPERVNDTCLYLGFFDCF